MRWARTLPKPTAQVSLIRFWYDQGVLGVLSVVAGIANYFFSVALAHELGPRRFGAVATLLNIVAILLIPLPAAALLYTRIGRRPGARAEASLLWLLGLALFAVPLVLGSDIRALFRLRTLDIGAFAGAVVPSFAYAANLGALQRSRRYLAVGLLGAATSFLNLFAVLVALSLFGAELWVLGLALSLVSWLVWLASRFLSRELPAGEPTPTSKVLFGTAAAGALATLYSLSDSLVARHVLPPVAAGYYIGVSTIGSALSYFATPFGTVMLTAALEEPEATPSFLKRALLLFGVTSGLGELLLLAATRPLIRAVLGEAFLPASPYLAPYGLAMIALGLVDILLLYSVASGRWPPLTLAALGYGVWLLSLTTARSLSDLTFRTLWAFAATGAAMALSLAVSGRSRGEAAAVRQRRT